MRSADDFGMLSRKQGLSDILIKKEEIENFSRQGSDFFKIEGEPFTKQQPNITVTETQANGGSTSTFGNQNKIRYDSMMATNGNNSNEDIIG